MDLLMVTLDVILNDKPNFAMFLSFVVLWPRLTVSCIETLVLLFTIRMFNECREMTPVVSIN